MSIGIVDYLSGLYHYVRLESIDDGIRENINSSEAAVNALVSTTPAIDRAIAEYRENTSFSQMITDMEKNEQAALELGK